MNYVRQNYKKTTSDPYQAKIDRSYMNTLREIQNRNIRANKRRDKNIIIEEELMPKWMEALFYIVVVAAIVWFMFFFTVHEIFS